VGTWDDVRRIAMELPEVSEDSGHSWRVRNKGFVWERPLRRADLEWLGDAAPKGPILGIRVEHLGIKDALIASAPNVFFATPHFNGYPALLVQLDHIGVDELRDVIVDAWLVQAPKRLAKEFLGRASSGVDQSTR
jgi:hypothetical protein